MKDVARDPSGESAPEAVQDTVQEWALARVLRALEPLGPLENQAETLEIGCGSGGFTRALEAAGVRVQCADVDRWHEDLEGVQHTPGADLSGPLPFEDARFGAVVALEVLEHVTDPWNAVRELARILQKEGQLFLTLPNFWNVLKGSMSLVGPRPLVPEEADLIGLDNPRFDVKPGITGYAQVHGRDSISVAERTALDEEYVEMCSMKLDVKILLDTFGAVLRTKGEESRV